MTEQPTTKRIFEPESQPLNGLLAPNQQAVLAEALRKVREIGEQGVIVILTSAGGYPRKITWNGFELDFPRPVWEE